MVIVDPKQGVNIMVKEKFFTVKVGRNPGVYKTWNQCEEQIKGFSGAVYKLFSSLEDADKYIQEPVQNDSVLIQSPVTISIDNFNNQIEQIINELKENEIIAFVDGSYNDNEKKSAFGTIIIDHNREENQLYKAFTEKLSQDFIALRNVAAELEGVKEAISWAINYKKKKISIYYDYEGIEKWANNEWRAKNKITKDYVAFINEKKVLIEIIFIKVPAHSGVKYNEQVDLLAKKALLVKGHKTYNDGSIYFVGYGVKDWNAIVKIINEENENLTEQNIPNINVAIEKDKIKDRIIITQLKNKVTINCYNDNKSYVQGKQTVLFQKIIATAIEMLSNDQKAIEILNCYHALTINVTEVENQFTQLLPNYKFSTEKHQRNLLSAVYNSMLTGYMPDYTCLVTPLFRAYEYYLHKILGKVMGLQTETNAGKNNFSFFSKNAKNIYECNNAKKSKLNKLQLDYLNKLYNSYNSIRHPYSHWSANDIEVAIIDNIAEARNLLLDGLKVVDEYHTLYI